MGRPFLFNRLTSALDARSQLLGGGAAGAKISHLVELFVQGEHFLEQSRRHLLRLFRAGGSEALELEQVTDPRDRLFEGSIRVVQIRRTLQARPSLRWRRVV